MNDDKGRARIIKAAAAATALVLALILPGLVIYLLVALPVDFAGWQALFAPLWLRVLMTLTAAALALHAWVGMRNTIGWA